MGFKASDVVKEETYDFAPYVKGDEAQGVTPEPSSDQIMDFQDLFRTMFGQDIITAEETKDDPIAAVKAALEVDSDEAREKHRKMLEAVAALCSKSPDVGVLLQLPFRIQLHYVGHVTGTFMRPEALRPATNS